MLLDVKSHVYEQELDLKDTTFRISLQFKQKQSFKNSHLKNVTRGVGQKQVQ